MVTEGPRERYVATACTGLCVTHEVGRYHRASHSWHHAHTDIRLFPPHDQALRYSCASKDDARPRSHSRTGVLGPHVYV